MVQADRQSLESKEPRELAIRNPSKRCLALQVFGGSAHSNTAIEFGLRGVGTTNSNSCASGNVAIGEAMR